ncbi:MAG: serine/threonine protein kinase [Verrucomicrobia bacterium]|jgi:serine/threonine protein kinase|nr:serine/threonine protein kinase [Verrucomicrobiota bacterium]|tara:strand:+ start:5286 stop:7709 length:2424 start_codon:yes stop_codon:yes gene_type:complete
MEERYEIKGKIGQGGLGAVYKAHDVRMNREVAIKRIVANTEDDSLPEEATRQLIKEAGSLASLQHPNIVTIYDVGTDEDGPFVVMELLAGDTLEEIIQKGSFTWQDFKQLAPQILEALIAAQELHLVHRDLKPSNIMLTWLPSGKFQVKIVDFGLAKLSAKPSLQTIDQSDGVFGSIYFMAPEQFERVPIDHKADLYAIGCVFYYALTGTYPYDGDSAAEVMASHLQHHITPIQEVRDGIPLWACDWIMWHINRQPSDRPEDARQALKYFVENDAVPDPPLSSGTPAPAVEQPKRAKLIVPGSAPVPEVVKEPTPSQTLKSAAAPKPLAPPKGSKPSVHTTAQVLQTSRLALAAEAPAEPEKTEEKPEEKPAAVVPVKVDVSETAPVKPTPAPASTHQLKPGVAKTAPLGSVPTARVAKPEKTVLTPVPKKKQGMSSGIKAVIAVFLGLLTVVLAVTMLKKSGNNAETKIYNQMITIAAKPDATELPIDANKLDILLRNAVSVASNKDRYVVYKALFLAKATDGTDIDGKIAEFATTREMIPNIRIVLIRDVLRKRKNPAVIGTLLDYARSTDDTSAAVASLEAIRFMVTEEHFTGFIEIIQTTEKSAVRKAAETNAAKIIDNAGSKDSLEATLAAAHDNAFNDVVRHSMLRLLAGIGGEKALDLAKENLQSDENQNQIAAIVALGNWKYQTGFKALIDFIASGPELQLRGRAYDSAIGYATESEDNIEENWKMVAEQAKTQDEKIKLIRGVAISKAEPWAFAILQEIVNDSDNDKAVDLAERAIVHLKDVQQTQSPNKKDPAEDEE